MNHLLHKLTAFVNYRVKLGVIVLSVSVGILFVQTQTSLQLFGFSDSVCTSNHKAAYRYATESDETFSHDDMYNDTINFREERTHILFLKIHKAASSTMQNIFYRFGLIRNLSFVLPIYTHYISKEIRFFSDVFPPLPPAFCEVRDDEECEPKVNRKYDILCNHMVFNQKKCNQLLHSDTMYIAIVREPYEQFLSSAYYYKNVWKFPYLKRLSNETFIIDLIRDPKKFESTSMLESMTFNSMAYDFGFNFVTVEAAEGKSEDEFEEFLNKTKNTFDIVLVKEKFDESLVLMKRMLQWQLRDILFIKNNEYMSKENNSMNIPSLSAEDMNLFMKRNIFDYGIYELFRGILIDRLSNEPRIDEEVEQFRVILNHVRDFCASKIHQLKELKVTLNKSESNATETTNHRLKLQKIRKQVLKCPKSDWNQEFSINVEDCEFMSMPELDFYGIMKSRHEVLLKSRRRKPNVL